jgi:hypothetical protein
MSLKPGGSARFLAGPARRSGGPIVIYTGERACNILEAHTLGEVGIPVKK